MGTSGGSLRNEHLLPPLCATSPLCKEYISVEREGQNTTAGGKVFNLQGRNMSSVH
jgi:hypothetical protein